MRSVNDIFEAIDADGFKASTLQLIDEFINDIENGSTDFPRFNQQEHAGLCKAGEALIGASIIASYASRSNLQQVAMLKAAKEAQQTGK